ncbi:MAG: FmdB family transcriptional regulator [Ferrovum sp. 37-45-19]|jgi:putative FmdB family regulatory protein|uniref:FmdB family zinc ribbon protein n=1 Tax=Ferrovum sp. JA12 TaxID=1356299 RepID=UPI0007033CEF|nr:FmdB family zinc ribbon protein [Ferrovum sp. JA12]OYV79171.1 MAG: FmdB family transcriptional regulator [Ferrovum sp. 21-44-67]OYV93532.1 MAG: FmdB family transcriptional regulator [Ferrovum sp. 37-45-19]OZB33329.1 MAG: FmdB family transcriptional regulator [Ferrovum sp. 34-44-207]HQT81798.1 zinc ribbon domain-containing protein [Ferrovaceae bacterium]KRH79626.1 zinc ribbon domain protein [Ferrovum sp. JA12]
MPLYEYRCQACGKASEMLQKMSDPPKTLCPHCGQEALAKQVSAAGFQLKGSGWYVTDFRGQKSGSTSATPSTASADSAPATNNTNSNNNS